VNAPLVSLLSKNRSNVKSEVRFKELIHDLSSVVRSQSSTPTLTGNLNEHPILIILSTNWLKNVKSVKFSIPAGGSNFILL
jgi:hypothetical protein